MCGDDVSVGAKVYETEHASLWDALHRNPRFRPRYPNDSVVRFVRTLPAPLTPENGSVRALDVGCGGGRHTLLLAEAGFEVDAVDISGESLRFTRTLLAEAGYRAGLAQSSATGLPFEDDSFDVALSYGVFYYGTFEMGRASIGELFRVLKPRGRAFVVARTTDDYRYGRGAPLGARTFRCESDETNERGMVMHFLAAEDVQEELSTLPSGWSVSS